MRGVMVALWLALLAEAVFLAPAARPDQAEWILGLLTGRWSGEEPWIVAHFMLMGAWPFVLGAQLSSRLRRSPVPLWPFALSSMVVGAFGLLPGLAIGGRTEPEASWQRWLRHPVWLAAVGLGAAGLVGWAVSTGDLGAWARAFASDQFVHVMTWDFVALWITSVLVAADTGAGWAKALVPVWGGLWSALRPS